MTPLFLIGIAVFAVGTVCRQIYRCRLLRAKNACLNSLGDRRIKAVYRRRMEAGFLIALAGLAIGTAALLI